MLYDTDFKRKYLWATSEKLLYLTILPTEKCNFRCIYCYEDFEIGKMSDTTVKAVKNLISAEAPKLKVLIISWFGGEPTLNRRCIETIMKHAMGLQKEYGFKISSGMSTNGYLLDHEYFSSLIALNVTEFQITLDGDQADHDKTRVLANGNGTFNTIFENISGMHFTDFEFKIILRIHVSKTNCDSVINLCTMLDKKFGQDKRFSIFIKGIENLGPGEKNMAGELTPEQSKKNRLIHYITKEIGLSRYVTSKSESNPYICYASMPRHFMIRADGSVGKCTVMFDDNRNSIGKLENDGTINLNEHKEILWSRGFASMDSKTLGCPSNNLPKLIDSNIIAVG